MNLTIDGHRDLLFSADISGATITYHVVTPAIRRPQVVKLAYNNIFARSLEGTIGGLIIDRAGNALALFDEITVGNNSTLPGGATTRTGPTLSTDALTIDEGGTATYTVRLPSQPTGPVGVTLNTIPDVISLQPQTLTFTVDDWDTPQTVTLTARSDTHSFVVWAVAVHTYSDLLPHIGRSSSFLRVVVENQDTPLVVSGGSTEPILYAENGTTDLATYSVTATTVTWAASGEDRDAFAIGSTGVLSFVSPPDFENPSDADGDNVYTVGIVAADGSATGLAFATVVVANVELPEFPSATMTRSVAENTAAGVGIGAPVTATTVGAAVTYTLAGTDAASFDIDAATGQLQAKAALDYETRSSYEVTVTATNSEGSVDIMVTIDVTNIIELQPITGPATVDYEENRAVRVAAYSASSEADRELLTWSLSGADAGSFRIDEPGGVLRFDLPVVFPNLFSPQPDYEAPTDTGNDGTYEVTVEVSDGTDTVTLKVTVTITNLDEAGAFSLFPTNPLIGTVVQARLSDPDEPVNEPVNEPVWEWARSSDKSSWTAITDFGTLKDTSGNVTTAPPGPNYAPGDADTGMYFRVRVAYTDGTGSRKTLQVISNQVVRERAPAPDITIVELVSDLTIPWDLAFTPDGTMLFTERPGKLSARLASGTIQTVTADFSDLQLLGSNGLLAIVVDHDFATNRRFYTCQSHTGRKVQIIAWTISSDYTAATRVADPLVGDIPSGGGGHPGCRLRIGPEGYLWIATGDGYSPSAPQDLGSLAGKILRVDVTAGDGAPGNPFSSRVYSYGHRDPQGLALRPGTTEMWSMEHGPNWDDEINLLVAGANYGWDPADGPGYNHRAPMTDLRKFPDALEAKWSSEKETLAISGGIFLDDSAWGAWNGRLAVAALKAQSLNLFEFDSSGTLLSHVVVPELHEHYGRLRTPMTGPDGALYVTTSNGTSLDYILKVVPSLPPQFSAEVTTQSVEENRGASTVVATVTAIDPEGGAVTYTLGGGEDARNFNIANPDIGEVRADAPLDYETKSSYTVDVIATDPWGLDDAITLTINVENIDELPEFPSATMTRSVAENTGPGVSIGAPVTATTVGAAVTYTLGGTDAASFDIVEATGQLQTKAALDYETRSSYEVTVTATNLEGSVDIMVTIDVTNVIELQPLTGPATVDYEENRALRVATYTASSEEDQHGIGWTVTGTDAAHFTIDTPGGALRFHIDPVAPNIFPKLPDFESPDDTGADNEYSISLLVQAGSTISSPFAVTVTVTDVDEAGALSLSSTRPALGAVLRAVLTDPDGVTAGTALWQWERSTGRNAWAVIDGGAAASYTPVAADTNTFLRVTATYADEHGTGKTVSEVVPNVVTGPLLTGLTAETDDSRADTARGLYPAFDPQTLHYGIGCNSTDTLVLTVSAAANARVAVAGVQAASAPEAVSVAVSTHSDVAIRVTDASGAGTTYVVHCLPEVFFEIETHTFPNTDAFEDLILFSHEDYFRLMDRNGVPRLHLDLGSGPGTLAVRFHRVGADGAYRYGFRTESADYTILDEDFEVVADGVRTVAPLTRVNNHDFQILEDGNYLLMSYEPATRDFSDIDLPYLDGAAVSSVDIRDAAFQIVTPGGHAVFTWNSWGNMAIEDCVQHRFPVTLSTDPDMRSPEGGYAHINGMHVVDGVLVASMRGCSKVLGIDVKPGVTRGDVLWRMGRTNLSDAEWAARDIGPRPLDFINDPEGEFCGQHTARFLPNGNIFLFDNGVVCAIDPWTFEELGREGYDFSRAVEYALDLDNHEAVFVRDHSLRGERRHLGYSTGNVDVLDNGDWLVSWGRVLTGADRFPDNEMATLVDPATGQEKLGIRFRELPSNERLRRINATVAPAEALAPQPEPLTALLPSSSHTSVFHTGAGDSPQVVVAFNQPVVDFDETTPSLSVTGATVASVSLHVVAGEAANAYVVTLTPAGASDITVRLVADQPCADGGICTAGETLLSEVPASHVIRADTTPPTVSKIEVSSNPGTDRTYAAGDEIQVTVTFSETVEVTGTPQLTLELGGGQRTGTYEGGSGTAALVFGYTVAAGESDTDGVGVEADSLSGGTIRDDAGHSAVLKHDGLAADLGHKVDGVKPELAASGGAVVNGTRLTLTYDEPLDGSSTPATGDFTVSGGDQARTVTGVRVNGSAVELTLDVGAEHLEAGIQVSYTPGDNPIQDVPGNEAETLSRETVDNETPDTTAPTVSSLAITSSPGSDQTYAAGEEIELTVTFSEAVEVEGTPQLRLRVGTRNRTAGYDSGTGTASLVFAYEVADGDEDTGGVSIEAGRIALNGGTIEDAANNPAELAHESVATQAGHKVDGVRPAFVSAAVDGASLTLTYGEALDGGSRPAPGDFTVQVGGTGRSVSGVSISDAVVTLTLNPEVEHGDTGIRVSYTPGTNPLRDAVGNDALGLSNRSLTNTTGAPNTAPQITSPSSFDVPENQAMVRRLAARDTDPGDEVTGWAIVGGTDRGQFAITSDTGDLSFRTAPDFEAPGDNAYEVTVEVRSGAGARELEAEQTFTLTVTDEREPPGIPEAPTFSGETADSLTVNWSEPDNTGPAISDYDVQYREKGTGRFIDGQHEGPELSLMLDDLEPGTVYEVQVRATNDEGTSNWSESGEGMTVMPLTVQMTSDIEPPVEGPFTVRFSFSEPVRGFSTSDIETGQDPACMDDQNTPVLCGPAIGGLETVDDRIFTTTVTPVTDGVAHNYTLTITVPANAVTSVVGNKPNEAAALEVRIAPPGVTAPISTIGLRASPGNGRVTLRWNTPANTGGAPIVRYEYRWKESGGEFSDWISVGSGTRSATVRNLTNGAEYTFEARAVNALGKGSAETAVATPTVVTRPPVTGGGGGGGGSGRGRPPSYPGTIQAEGGDGEVTLTWDAPSSQGSSRIQHYEYRIDGEGEWISTGSTDRIHTITGLTNGRVYFVHLRAVSAAGAGSHRISPEATPVADLDFTHFANGGFITSTLALVNAGAYPVRPAIYFYDQDGDPIAARRVVELTPDLEVGDDGALSPRTVMNPLGELTIATHGRGGLRVGSVTVSAPGSIGGVLRFDIPGFGVAGVGDSPTIRDALVPVRRQEGGINTGVAVRNRGTATLTLQCRLMRDGAVLEETVIPLAANGQDSRFIDQVFPTADTSDFAGSVRCAAPEPGRFSAVAFELDGVHRIFTTLPVVPVPAVLDQEQEQEDEQDQAQEEEQDATRLDFTHFANGGKIVSSLVLVNAGTDPVRPAIYFYDQDGGSIAAEAMLDVPADMEIGDDGALRPGTAMNPLGELTISTHGRGVLKVGSVAGVGDSPPVRDALVPVRRQDGGINTGVAVHNRGTTALLVRCRLMRDGAVLEETMIPLAANGQDSRFIDQVFPTADTSDFVGSVRCMTPEPGRFSAVAFELDGINRIFTTLPVVPVVEVP